MHDGRLIKIVSKCFVFFCFALFASFNFAPVVIVTHFNGVNPTRPPNRYLYGEWKHSLMSCHNDISAAMGLEPSASSAYPGNKVFKPHLYILHLFQPF